jgi:hypothetical protein
MVQVLVAAVLVVAAFIVAAIARRRAHVDAPSQPENWPVPAQLDRADFDHADSPWLVVVFSSATCDACALTLTKARVLECGQVAVHNCEFGAQRSLHERYHIQAVPLVVIADGDGVVRASFVGPPTATDLWAALAELREPGSSPEPNLGR